MESSQAAATSKSKFRIAIIGSGPIGKLLACSAATHPRIEIVQYEADVLPLRPSFGYGVGPQTLLAAKVLNPELGRRLEETCYTSRTWMRAWHGGAEDRFIANVEVPEGKVYGRVGRGELMGLLDDALPEGRSAQDIRYGKRLVDVRRVGPRRLELVFEDETREFANAVWAADGVNSTCRKLVQGDAYRPPSYTGFLAFRGKVDAAKVADALGEPFTRESYCFVGAKGWHLLIFPIENNTLTNVAAFCIEPERKKLGRGSKVTMDELLGYFPGRNAKVEALLTLMQTDTPGGCQRLELSHLGTLGTVVNPDLCMTTFGDAANAMTPHIAGSMSCGFIGCTAFLHEEWNPRVRSGQLRDNASDDEIAEALMDASRRYEEKHLPLAQRLVDASLEQASLWTGGISDVEVLRERPLFLWGCVDDRSPPGMDDCESAFGPAAGSCSDRFDFTLLFEQYCLSIAPSALLLVAIPPRLLLLSGRSKKVHRTSLAVVKLASGILLGALQLALAALWARHSNAWSPVQRAATAASSLGVVASLALTVLSYVDHSRCVRPSSITALYLVGSIALDAVQCRTLWSLGDDARDAAHLFTAMVACKAAMLCFETRTKRGALVPKWQHAGPEETSGIISRLFFWWLNGLLVTGYNGDLSVSSSLYDLDGDLVSEPLLNRLRVQWRLNKNADGKYPLLWALLHAVRGPLLVCVVPRLCYTALKFAQPFLLLRVVQYMDHGRRESPATGYGLIAAAGLVYTGNALTAAFYQHKQHRYMAMIRGALSALIMYETADLSSAATGRAAVTLITADANRIADSFAALHDIWASILQLFLAIWLLQRLLGLGSIGPLIVVAVSYFLMKALSARMPPAQKSFSGAIEKRVSTTSSIVSSMKEVKMLGVVGLWLNKIQELMVSELAYASRMRMLVSLMNVFANIPSFLAPMSAFGIAIVASGLGASDLSVGKIFTSLAIINLISGPLANLLYAVPNAVRSLASFDRIQEFLDKVEEARALRGEPIGGFEAAPYKDDGAVPAGDSIVVENASFRFKQEGDPVLKDINIRVRQGSLVVVVGKVGTGKSALLSALLGELSTTGRVYMDSNVQGIAYCAQTPWLVNGTIRQNIIAQSTLDQEWYDAVVSACALNADFEELPRGDESLVGSKGISLSGGQKHRVALARAVYAKRKVILVDDVLSGLDWSTQGHVWAGVFGPQGLLRRNQTTVILATHYIKRIQDADSVIILDDGTIAVQDSPEVISQVEQFTQLLSQGAGEPSGGAAPVDDNSEAAFKAPTVTKVTRSEAVRSDDGKAELLVRKSGEAAFNLAASIWMKNWAEANESGQDVNTGFYYGIYSGLEIANTAFMGFDICKDMSFIDLRLPVALMTTWFDFRNVVMSLILVLPGSSYLSIAVPFTLVYIYLLQKFYLRTSRQLRHHELQSSAPLNTHILETIDGLATIRAFGWRAAYRRSALGLLDESQKPHYLLFCIQRWLSLALDLYVAILAVFLVALGVLVPESSTKGAMALALINVLGLGSSLTGLVNSWTSLETSLGALARIRDFEARTSQEIAPAQPEEKLISDWPSRGDIEFCNATASYSSGSDSVPAIDHVSLRIKAGEKIAICGRTGSGKSSMLLTLFRLLDLDAGSITIDGLDIAHIPQNKVRQSLICVPQEPTLFPGTIRSNLWLAEDSGGATPSDDELRVALESVALWDAISSQSDGLNTDISAVSLSQGQKQLLCLCRAVLRRKTSAVLVLDEAMSAVDGHTEQVMVRVLESEFAEHTVVSVAHRLNTVRNFDTVVVLEGARVVEVGQPEALLEKPDGKLRALWNSQA
ncbi:ABC multidrug transporter [Purpureocillium lavendulum]|uniref:ABC multidrug transporter n=1 Tax=Purpureocillium lavendulum TaxID=1247861 RepID=A0AB34FMD6_9HYPO|nr:ABC multidrug transporter [Purpureocillium lavendulum]